MYVCPRRINPALFALVLLTLLSSRAASQTVASRICTNIQTFYRNDSQAEFFVCGQSDGGVAVFEGPTTDNAPPNGANFSDAFWTSGQTSVGKFGDAQFRTSLVDATHRNYYLAVVQTGLSLPSQLSAKIYGRDGLSRPTFTGPVPIPDPSGSFPRSSQVQLFAPVGPADGSSSLELSVLQNFVAHDLASAMEDLDARVKDLTDHHPELVRNPVKAAAYHAAVEAGLELVTIAASKVGYEFLAGAVPMIGQIHLIVDFAGTLLDIYLLDKLVANVVQAQLRLEQTLAIEETLAKKTFLPERIEITGLNDGANNVIIGGPGQRYRNDFQDLAGGKTTGTSRFFNSTGQLIAIGTINTQNFFDSNGNVFYAESNISLSNGSQLFRKGFILSPWVTNADGSLTSGVRFKFFAAPTQNASAPFGSFNQGLNGFSTTGNVSLTTSTDGRTAALLTESSPSSVATDATVPSDPLLLVFDYRWTTSFNPLENAVLSVDLTSDNVSTQLVQLSASNEFAHSSEMQRLTVALPSTLQRKHGVVRFQLIPSDSDGVTSEVMLGGFDLVSQPLTLTAPLDVTSQTGPNATTCGAVINDAVLGTAVASISGVTVTRTGVPLGNLFPVGVTTVTYTATDPLGRTATATQNVTVVDNTPPTVKAPASITAYTGPGSTSCGVTIADLGTANASDNCAVAISRSGVPANSFFPVGTTTITHTAIDSSGNTKTAQQTVTVIDNTPPVITLDPLKPVDPSVIWPPNKKLVLVTVNYTMMDNCDPSPTSALSVSSNEGTSADWEIVDAHHVKLRADRAGNGGGRVYTIKITSTDHRGNSVSKTVTVTVPHDQGH